MEVTHNDVMHDNGVTLEVTHNDVMDENGVTLEVVKQLLKKMSCMIMG